MSGDSVIKVTTEIASFGIFAWHLRLIVFWERWGDQMESSLSVH